MMHTKRALRGMVTSPHHLASQAGLEVLADGGNAVDAAVATAAALAVVYPHMTGIGGDGFWLVSEPDGRVWAVDACGPAAAGASLELYEGHETIPWRGPLAANTVAGTIGGWEVALREGGAGLSLERLLRDAIEWARTGYAVTRGQAEISRNKGEELRQVGGAYRATFQPLGVPLEEGDVFQQPRLADTLERLAEAGLHDFYRGELAASMAKELEELGSPLRASDLFAYQAETSTPLRYRGRDGDYFNLGPPTQGAASLIILALFERLVARGESSFSHVHGLVEATKQAFLFRDEHIGDPLYMRVDPQALLDDAAALDALAAQIDPARALEWPRPSAQGDTVWFGAADRFGQVVSCIQSTYFEHGSGIVLPSTGVTWQNRGSSFRLAESGWNALRPGRKPFHTLNPALAKFTDGRVLAYGTMGGEGQPQTQAALLTRYQRFGMSLQEAVAAPRWLLGRTWGDTSTSLKLEEGFAPELYEELRAAGHQVEIVPPLNSMMGHAGAVARHPNGLLEGAADPRSDGLVAAR